MQVNVTFGGFKGLRKLPPLTEMMKINPRAVFDLPAGLAVVTIDLGRPMTDLQMAFALARWDADLGVYAPVMVAPTGYAALFPRSSYVSELTLAQFDPSAESGIKSFTVAIPQAGSYILLYIGGGTSSDALGRFTVSPAPVMAGGTGGGGGAHLDTLSALDGSNVAASIDGLVKSIAGAGDPLYTGPAVRLPRAGNIVAAFDAAFDADGIIVSGHRFGLPVRESIATQAGKTVQGNEVFDAHSDLRIEKFKSGSAGTVSLGIGNKLGSSAVIGNTAPLLYVDDALAKLADMKLDVPRSAIELAPAIGFDGKRVYRLLY